MNAAVTAGDGTLELEDRPRPEPKPGEVLVRVRAVGICGSDVGLVHGEGPPWTEYPLVPGHEVCAEVVTLGDGVDDLAVGDRVALHGFVYCGACRACREGRYYQCDELKEIGFTLDGGYREYAAFPAATLTPVPDGLSDAEVTQIDSAACTLHGLHRTDVRYTDTAVVIGPGSLGLFGVQLLQARGVDDIVVTGLRDDRLETAARLGASETVDVTQQDPVDAIHEYTDGRGADLVVETAGASEVVDTALASATRGGDVVLLGAFGEYAEIDPNDIVAKELTVFGSVTAAHAVDEVIDLFARDALTVDGIVTHEFDLTDVDDAFDTVENKRDGVIKALLRP